MKIVKLSTMGGTGKLTARRAASASDGFDEKLAVLKQRAKTDTQLVKKHLTQFIKRTFSLPDDVSVTTALLELGFEREIELHGEEDAQDLRRLHREVRDSRDISLWALLVELMQQDTEKHLSILRFVTRHTARSTAA